MRTGLFLLSGFLFLAGSLITGKLFSSNFLVPVVAAVLVRWKLL